MLRGEETCACKLLEELNITQPTLSHHMKLLCDAGDSIDREGAAEIGMLLHGLVALEDVSQNHSCKEG